MASSRPRQNFSEECETLINKQINMELYASYVYLSMAYYFERGDVALAGFTKYFTKCSDEEREHAQKLMSYQNMRGGAIILDDIKKPASQDWKSGINAMTKALDLEKLVNNSLLELHVVATKQNDAQLCDFLESEYLKEQVEHIKELSDHITNLQRVAPGLGEYMFDKETLGGGGGD